MELGASIFVKANKNLWKASNEFNLTRRTLRDENYEIGIWDGEKLRISVSLVEFYCTTHLIARLDWRLLVGHHEGHLEIRRTISKAHREYVSILISGSKHTY
jgi:hypothetical protein